MNIDKFDFDNTAQAVYIMNDSARFGYADWQELRDFMVSMAYQYMHKSASFSTGGFQLTAFDSNGERHVRASVSAYLALSYLKESSLNRAA